MAKIEAQPNRKFSLSRREALLLLSALFGGTLGAGLTAGAIRLADVIGPLVLNLSK